MHMARKEVGTGERVREKKYQFLDHYILLNY